LQFMVRAAREHIPEICLILRLAPMAARVKILTCPDCLKKKRFQDLQDKIDGMSAQAVRQAVETAVSDVEDLNSQMEGAIKVVGEAMKSLQQEQKDKLRELRMLQEAQEWWDKASPQTFAGQFDTTEGGFWTTKDRPILTDWCEPMTFTCHCGLGMVLVVSRSASWMPIGKKVLLCSNDKNWEKCGLVLPEEKWDEYRRRYPRNFLPPPPGIFVHIATDRDL